MSKTWYISGPMTGYPEFNFPAFDGIALHLGCERDERWGGTDKVYSPAAHDREVAAGLGWPDVTLIPGYDEGDVQLYAKEIGHGAEGFLVWDIAIIVNECTDICMLPGWEHSSGAKAERYAAEATGKQVWLANKYKADTTWYITLDDNQQRLTQALKFAIEGDPVHAQHLQAATAWYEAARQYGGNIGPMPDPYTEWHTAADEANVGITPEWAKVTSPEQVLNGLLHTRSALDGGVAPGEVRITNPNTGGQKGSKDVQLGCAPPEGLRELGRVFAMGAAKYERHNFRKGYDWSLSSDALLRHVIEWLDGNDLDDESGLNHLAHAAWHCLNLIQYGKDHPELDDRWKG